MGPDVSRDAERFEQVIRSAEDHRHLVAGGSG